MGTQAALETAPRVSSYEADKEAAREIQYSLVPTGNLISACVEVAYRFSPFAEVGGDFTDFFLLPMVLLASTWAMWWEKDSPPQCMLLS